ncbi:MAG: hypothetical protein U0169_27380 [Polyangiaceae bacterium]
MRRSLPWFPFAAFAVACSTASSPAADSGAGSGPDDGGADAEANVDASLPSPPADAGTSDADPDVARTTTRVLFVGNSYTEYNDLPSVVRAVVEASGPFALATEAVTIGGASLAQHWAGDAKARVEAGGHDVVVLQGQSTDPFGESDSGNLFSRAVRDAGGRAVWFSTWARAAGDPMYAGDPDGPHQMWTGIERQYTSVAERNDEMVARTGAAFEVALAELPAVNLYQPDGSHPTAAGTVLAACVIAQAITGVTPRAPESPIAGVAASTAKALCAIAERVRCAETKSPCGTTCVALATNPRHCGTCGNACAAENPCRAGMCGCDSGFLACSGSCVEPKSDRYNCGGCRIRCTEGQACSEGACACTGGTGRVEASQVNASILEPTCTAAMQGRSLACLRASHRFCASRPCFASGLGPASGHATGTATLCVPGTVRTRSVAEVQATAPACDPASPTSVACRTGAHRTCVNEGFAAGFGPVDATASEFTVTCLTTATLVPTTAMQLVGQASRCTADAETCTAAAWTFCESRGHGGGFGPYDDGNGGLTVVCVPKA